MIRSENIMKVVAFNGSPRKGGNTEFLIRRVLETLEKQGIETEFVQLGGNRVSGCSACQRCFETKDGTCAIKDDIINDCIAKVVDADGLILGSPTYFTDVTAEMKAFIDRLGFVAYAHGSLLRRKVGAAVVAVRRGGATHVFDTINHLYQMSQMLVVGSTYWNFGFGLEKGDVAKDDEGLKNMENIAENMAWVLEKIKKG
jgi:multimeric flavodoxin WrbA